MKKVRWFGAVIFLLAHVSAPAQADLRRANIFVYYGIEPEDAHDNPLAVSLEQFKSHLNIIQAYHWPVAKLSALQQKQGSETALALTFDNPSRATVEALYPLVNESHLPVTLFFTSDALDRQNDDTAIGWQDVRLLQKNKWFEIGMIGKNYTSFADMDADSRAKSLNAALARFEEKLGARPTVIALPYGDYDSALLQLLKKRKLEIILGTQSGSADLDTDVWPRFSMTDRYSDDERFKAAATAQPIKVSDVLPESSIAADNPPAIGLTLDDQSLQPQQLKCFSNADQALQTTILDRRIELRFPAKIAPARIRVNCTAVLKNEDSRPYLKWWGLNLLVR